MGSLGHARAVLAREEQVTTFQMGATGVLVRERGPFLVLCSSN